jgi:hypothetical protein
MQSENICDICKHCDKDSNDKPCCFCMKWVDGYLEATKYENKDFESENDFKNQYPNFTISCNKCGSTLVYIENSLGFSAISGCWGSVDLVCSECGNETEIVKI